MPRKSKSKSKTKKVPAVSKVPGANFITPAPEPDPPRKPATGVAVVSAPVVPAKVAPVVSKNTTITVPVISTTSTPLPNSAPTFESAFETFRDLFPDTFSPNDTMVLAATKAESVESSVHSSEFDTAIEIVPIIYPFPPPAPEAPVLDRYNLTWPLDVPKALQHCQLFGPGGSEVDCPLLSTATQISHLVDILHSATHPATLSSISPKGETIPTLFFDVEGTNLSRHGSISILQICVQRDLPTAYPADKNSKEDEVGGPEERRGGMRPTETFKIVDEPATERAKGNYPSKEATERQEKIEEERKRAGEVYLIDVHTLGDLAFTSVGVKNSTVSLKSILEDGAIPKVFFDVRNDSNALFFLFDIRLRCIHDLQVMQAATSSGSFIRGLGKCISDTLHISGCKAHRSNEPFIDSALREDEIKAVDGISKSGKLAFSPDLGGSYSVFLERPLAREMLHYCITDVALMPAIYARLRHSLDTWDKNSPVKAVDRQGVTIEIGEFMFNMLNASERRVFVSQLERYDPKSASKVLNPWQTFLNHNLELDINSSSRGDRHWFSGSGRGRGLGRGRGRGGLGGRGGREIPAKVIQPWDFSDGVKWVTFA